MNIVSVFKKSGWQIRTTLVGVLEGRTLVQTLMYVVNDLAEPLGLSKARMRHKFRELDDDEQLVCRIRTLGQRRKMMLVGEAGLYKLICSCPRSRKKGTLPYKFQRWVFHEVLPSIRRKGEYRLQLENELLTRDVARLEARNGTLRGEKQFLKNNRLYHIAWDILANTSANYRRVKNAMVNRQQWLHWVDNTPYVRPQNVAAVRTLFGNFN